MNEERPDTLLPFSSNNFSSMRDEMLSVRVLILILPLIPFFAVTDKSRYCTQPHLRRELLVRSISSVCTVLGRCKPLEQNIGAATRSSHNIK
jgi:hypothetical protein